MAQYDFTVLYERNPFVLKKTEDIGKSFKLPPSNFEFESLPQNHFFRHFIVLAYDFLVII